MPTIKLTEKTLAQDWLAGGNGRLFIRDQELPGFQVVVGPRRRTFMVDFRAGGVRRIVTIGQHGVLMPDGKEPWNVSRARQRARELIGQVAAGVDPTEPERARADGPTLRDGLDLHLKNMAKRRNSTRSTETLKSEVTRHLADWLDLPIGDLDGDVLNRIHDQIKSKAKRRAGGNAINAPGAPLANRVIRHVSAIWEALDRKKPFAGRNPTRAVVRDDIEPRGTRVNDGDFVSWYAAVLALDNPIRRDLQLMAMFTGSRSSSVRQVRWEHVDWKAKVVTFAFAKGGKPYAVPLGPRTIEILRGRERDNPIEFLAYDGDHGFVFPSHSRSRGKDGKFRVIATAGSKEYRDVKDPVTKKKRKVRLLPPVHDLRRTYNSVAIEIGVPKEARNMLLNHERQGVNVKHYGFPQNWEYLAECQAKIEVGIWARLIPAQP